MEELQRTSHRTGGSGRDEADRLSFDETLEKIIANTSLVLFVTLSAGWIAVTVQGVGIVIVDGNWAWLVLWMPMVIASVFFGAVLWVWMGEVSGTGRPVAIYEWE